MLVVKIEIWPFGDKTAARLIEEIHISNKSSSAEEDCPYWAYRVEKKAGVEVRHDRWRGALKLVEIVLRKFNRSDLAAGGERG